MKKFAAHLKLEKIYKLHPQLKLHIKEIQVSLAIRGGHFPDKFPTANTKTGSVGFK